MGLWPSRYQIQNKKDLTPEDLKYVTGSQDPFIQVETYPPVGPSPQQVFLDTSLQKILYGDPISLGGETPTANLSTVWIYKENQTCTDRHECTSGLGPFTISSVTTPIGQVQPTQQIGPNTYDMQVLPTPQEFLWNAEFQGGKYALYYDKPGVGKLYALPVKSNDPHLSPPRDTLIQAVLADPSTQDVFVFKFGFVDTVKFNPTLPSGIDIYLRPQS